MHKKFIAGVKDFFRGCALPFRAAGGLLTHPSCWLYALLPVLLCAALYLMGAILFLYYITPWLENFLPTDWTGNSWLNALYQTLIWLIRLGVVLFALTFSLFTFTTAYVVIAAPFVDKLAEVFERKKYGFDFQCPTWKAFVHYNWTSMVNSARIGLQILFWTLALFPVSLLLPGPGFLLPALVIGYFFGVSTLIYSSEHRRVAYRDFRHSLRGSRMIILGMGTVFYLLLMIPFAAIFCLPLAVIAGTMLYNEDIASGNQTSPIEADQLIAAGKSFAATNPENK